MVRVDYLMNKKEDSDILTPPSRVDCKAGQLRLWQRRGGPRGGDGGAVLDLLGQSKPSWRVPRLVANAREHDMGARRTRRRRAPARA